MTAPAVDNGALTHPLMHTNYKPVIASGSNSYPEPPIFRGQHLAPSIGSGTATFSGVETGPSTANDLCICVVVGNGDGRTMTGATVTIPGFSNPTATVVVSANGMAIFQFEKPGGLTATIVTSWSGGDWANDPQLHVYSVRKATLSSLTAVGSNSAQQASVTTKSVDIATSLGGIIIAATKQHSLTTEGAISGDAAYAEGDHRLVGACTGVVASASPTAADAANTVTGTFSDTATSGIIAASWR